MQKFSYKLKNEPCIPIQYKNIILDLLELQVSILK